MTNNTVTINLLLKSIEAYAVTNIQLYKLYLIDFISDLMAELYSKFIVTVLFILCGLFFLIGISIWLGSLMGKLHYGFILMSGLLLIVAFFLMQFKKFIIINPIYNSLAKKLKQDP